MTGLGIYVHIPFCAQKCRYCDFLSWPVSQKQGMVVQYFEELKRSVDSAAELYGNSFKVDTVFFGGGTPSIVDASLLTEVLDSVKSGFSVDKNAEISLESNPGTLTEEKLSAYRMAGFDRISIGFQSLDDTVLRLMGRIHDSARAVASYKLARRYFDNINIDLMLGVPKQTAEIWKDSLSRVIDLGPEHISFYSLQLEEGTPFYSDYRAGRLELPSWQENRDMYHQALEMLDSAGYVRYEVSNAARMGYECRHNLKYWNMQPYLGFGAAAHSFIGGRRFEDGAFPKLGEKELPFAAQLSEDLRLVPLFAGPEGSDFDRTPEQIAGLKGDFVFTQLRLAEGLDTGLYEKLFGCSFERDFSGALAQLLEQQYIEKSENRIRFTAKGLDSTNPVLEKFLSEIDDQPFSV